VRRVVALLAAAAVAALALTAAVSGAQGGGSAARGRSLFVAGCSSCHGMDARGIPGRGTDLHGVGALTADWYIRTGRMPLAHPTDEPIRAPSLYNAAQRADLVAYVASLGGPAIPPVDPRRGVLAEGKRLFSEHCAGCHQIAGQGGVVTPDVIAPPLDSKIKPIDVAEVVRIGPYVMPRFGRELDRQDVDDLARYVQHLHELPNEGGWSLGNLGPIPEGLVTWGIGIVVLLAVAGLVGERLKR
jgi:ubiquinol-cytochrome c reductase cytochrome c subunit